MAIDFQENIHTQRIYDPFFETHEIELGILRLDELHPVVSGNKWFKLKYNIGEAISKGYASMLTFGGAHSNHLAATAAAANAFGISCIGIVRGFHAKNNLTETLRACVNMGMELQFISRADYDQKEAPEFLNAICKQFPSAYIVPEGGNNENGRRGTEDIASFIQDGYTHVALSIGTGATFSGMRNAIPDTVEMLGFTAMKGGEYLEASIEESLKNPLANWKLITDYHFGGFAKHNAILIDFMNTFYDKFQIPLDMVYTSKMMYGIFDLIDKGYFQKGNKILCIHTGGLLGNHSVRHLLQYNSIS